MMGLKDWVGQGYRAWALGCLLPVLAWGQSSPETTPASAPSGRPSFAARRIVRHFHFDEWALGNVEDVPMGWQRHIAAGFPIFLEGKFDKQIGSPAPPSFRLDLNGGSSAYHYIGRDIAVQSNSDYRIDAQIKTASLKTARAYISVYYLNRKGVRIPGTERYSRFVGGKESSSEFQPVTVALKGNMPGARYIGLSVWLAQSGVWRTGARPLRHIEHKDIKATAWFDDISVYRLPRVNLQTAQPGNIFTENQPVELRTEVSDPDGLNLSAKLMVRSADGTLVDQRSLPIQSTNTPHPTQILYDDLPVGLYHVDLTVSTQGTVLIHRSLRFAKLSSWVTPPATRGRGFGIILNHVSPPSLNGQKQLLEQIFPEYVKIPVWDVENATTSSASSYDITDSYVEAIAQAYAKPIGVLIDNSPYRPSDEPTTDRSMLDIFSEDPMAWKPLIAGVWSRYAGLINIWQIGNDGDESIFLDDRLSDLVPILLREMKTLMSEPLLVSPFSAKYTLDQETKSDYLALTIPASISPDHISNHIQALVSTNPQNFWVTVEPLPERLYPRKLRLADLSRRLAESYFHKVRTVFLAAPWDVQENLLAAQVDPREDFIVLRTVADLLGSSTPIARTNIEGQADCLIFDRNGQAILFVWDSHAPPEGREHILTLGENAEQVDLWGQRTRLKSVGTRQIVRIGPMPTFIVKTPTWLMEFRRQFVLAQPALEASFDASRRDIMFRNTYHQPINGVLRLSAPGDWDIRPRKIPFSLKPGELFRQSIAIRFPLNAEAGVTALLGEFTFDAGRRMRIACPAWFELGVEDVDLDAYIYRSGDRVIVRQSMTNRSGQPVSFDGYVIAPKRQRITRLFNIIRTGQRITKDFILEDAADLVGKKIRVCMKDTQGTRIWNRILTVP